MPSELQFCVPFTPPPQEQLLGAPGWQTEPMQAPLVRTHSNAVRATLQSMLPWVTPA